MDSPALQATLHYLASPEALASVKRDPYWPKWDSPWWHMLTLYEMGEASKIPRPIADAMVDALNAMPVKIFPTPGKLPEGLSLYRHSNCHCGIGSIYQVLHFAGIEVDARLPWMRPWLLNYRMSDGGMTCDNDVYHAKDANPCPSSMVGTIAVFEALLKCTNRPYTQIEIEVLDGMANFFIRRNLMKASTSALNVNEIEDEADWLKPCFPRFYFYDVLRGLSALHLWAKVRGKTLPDAAIEPAKAYLNGHFPDGKIRLERLSFEGTRTLEPGSSGDFATRGPASSFPLLDHLSALGQISPHLTEAWSRVRMT